jgi:hypothetical protein
VKREFLFEGSVYSKKKASFKKILRKHGFAYQGSLVEFVWVGKNEKVVALFDRDRERDITISAKLTWSGKKKTDFLKDFEEWAKEIGGKRVKEAGKKAKGPKEDPVTKKKIKQELEFWDKLNKPDANQLKAQGRPEDWIERDVKEWRKKRKQKRKELLDRYG